MIPGELREPLGEAGKGVGVFLLTFFKIGLG